MTDLIKQARDLQRENSPLLGILVHQMLTVPKGTQHLIEIEEGTLKGIWAIHFISKDKEISRTQFYDTIDDALKSWTRRSKKYA